VVEEFDAIQLSLKDIYSEVESAVKILRHDGHKFKKIREDRTRKFMECFSSLETEVDAIYKVIFQVCNHEYFIIRQAISQFSAI
jgi:UDP-2,3-diacylglucosamine pyrophosphatase LpxH